MDRLIVKNFGPLKDIDIELNKINLFIGENGSGKSVLAKLITILSKFTETPNYSLLINELDKYHINFIKDDSFIKKDNIIIKNTNILVKIDKKTKSLDEVLGDMINKQKSLDSRKDIYDIHIINQELLQLLHKAGYLINIDYIPTDYKYIIAERNLISIFNKSISSMIIEDIPIPKFILEFASEYEKAREEIKELSFLNVRYENTDRDRIYYDKENYLSLEHSSSGIQSAIPMLLTAKYFAKKYGGIVIEEPEQNLFPKAQKEVVEFIIAQLSNDSSLFLMTHSPYILTSLNNLILANDVLQQKGEDAIKGIIDKKSCVAFKDISAYSIENGKAINIMDNENRLIGVNIIDSISEEIDETFDKLLGKLDI